MDNKANKKHVERLSFHLVAKGFSLPNTVEVSNPWSSRLGIERGTKNAKSDNSKIICRVFW